MVPCLPPEALAQGGPSTFPPPCPVTPDLPPPTPKPLPVVILNSFQDPSCLQVGTARGENWTLKRVQRDDKAWRGHPLAPPEPPRYHPAMCNLQRLDKAPAEIARLFGEILGPVTLGPNGNGSMGNFAPEGGETYPGQPGLVIHQDPVARGSTVLRQAQDERNPPTLTAMTWGFPFAATGKSGQKLKPRPVNNARADKLDSFMWRESFARRRCLIPLTAFAEAEGEQGAKTRTWFSLPPSSAPASATESASAAVPDLAPAPTSAHPEPVEGAPPAAADQVEGVFAAAGLWRDTPEWGLCYTMVMTEACRHVADVHDRMPVILARTDWSDWLDGAPDAAGLLCRPYPELMVVERTAERWVKR
ncbi:MAG: hypothetical protein JWQ16_2062 [Novosphingobium sp.]|nr:hypothetical protein [Novosphingobium sp.]